MTKQAKILMISLPSMEKDPTFLPRMKEISDEIKKVLEQAIGEKIEVVLWNTNVKFLSAIECTNMIKLLKKAK